jgi:hypothetical protein
MSIGTILLIVLIIILLGGFSGIGAVPSMEPATTGAAGSDKSHARTFIAAETSVSTQMWLTF